MIARLVVTLDDGEQPPDGVFDVEVVSVEVRATSGEGPVALRAVGSIVAAARPPDARGPRRGARVRVYIGPGGTEEM